MVETTGGFTTRSGRSVLVTPSGRIVGSTTPEVFGGGGSRKSRRDAALEAAKRRAEAEAKRKAAEEARRKLEASKRAAALQKQKEIKSRAIKQFKTRVQVSSIPIVRPPGIVSPVERSPGLRGKLEKISVERSRLGTMKLRGKETKKSEAKRFGLIVSEQLLKAGLGFVDLPKTLSKIAKDPSLLKKVPKAVSEEGKKFGIIAREDPLRATVIVGTELVLLKGTSKAIKGLEKATKIGATKVSPKFVGTAKTGKKLKVNVDGKDIALDVVGEIPGSSLKKQINLAGKRVDAISSQADKLIDVISKKKVVRKPLGLTKSGKAIEETLGKRGKKLLSKLDKGKINIRQLMELDLLIKKKGSKGILERAFFADPTGKIRPSRLGILKERKRGFRQAFEEFFVGDFTLKDKKPQILLFPDTEVAKFPKALKGIKKKLEGGKPLTNIESSKLLQFQLKKDSKFKPLGFASKESEITLAPGEIIKRARKVGTTIINGKPVPIVQAEIVKTSGKTKNLLTKFNKGQATKKEIKELGKSLKKKTKFDFNLSSSPKSKKSVVNVRGVSGAIVSRAVSKSRVVPKSKKISFKSITSGDSSRPAPRRKVSKSNIRGFRRSKISTGPVVRPTIRPTIIPTGPVVRPTIRPTIKVPVSRKKKKDTDSKTKKGFNVFVKSRGKFVRINKLPLTKKDALSRGSFAVDQTTSKTMKIVAAGYPRRLGSIKKKEQGYFVRNQKKLRNFKIIKGKRKVTPNKFIEKRKHGIDTKGEKQGLSLAKLIKREGFRKRG